MPISDSEIKFLAFNYYRNSNREDQTIVGGVSIGETIACVLWQGFASIAHYYEEFNTESHRTKQLELQSDASRLRQTVASVFYKVTTTGAPSGHYQNDESFLQSSHLPVAPLVRLFRFAQFPFKYWIRRKSVLFITNWATQSIARSQRDSIELFRKSLFGGAAPIIKRKYIRHGEIIFIEAVEDLFSRNKFVETLARFDSQWDEALVELCVSYAKNIYSEMRPQLVACFALYSDLLDNYKPRVCCLPSDSFPNWLIVYQICRTRGIRTHSYVDGYPVTAIWPIARDRSGLGWLVDEVAAFGDAHKKMVLDLGFPEERVFLVEAPFAKLQRINKPKYDFIIMSWFANCFSMYGNHLSVISTMKSALDIVVSSGAKSVGIKIKTPVEKMYILPLLKDFPIQVDILEGRFFEHVTKAKAVIGGISTALAECAIAGVPYYIFEPFENGYSDENLRTSVVTKLENVARTPSELICLIASDKSSWTATISNLVSDINVLPRNEI